MTPNLVLTGFMGTGKTSTGQSAAKKLGMPFVDMDAEIEARVGMPIRQIFAEKGELAFRQIETQVCLDLAAQGGRVIATGGGALLNPENRAAFQRDVLVCLNASVPVLARRLGVSAESAAPAAGEPPKQVRPLLNVADPSAEIERLLAARRPVYASLPWQVETDGLSPAEAADKVVAIYRLRSLPVRHPNGQYNIYIGEGALENIGGLFRQANIPTNEAVAVVSNSVVAPLHASRVEAALLRYGYAPFLCSVPDGESHKSLTTVESLYGQFLAGGLSRGGTVLGLGGGVTGDMAGFAAATYLRGVRYVQAPTTLLSMVDASVGGKVGVDLPQGKNLVGAFKQPELVVMDPLVLETLPVGELRSGMAEAIKHGILADAGLLESLRQGAGASGRIDPAWLERAVAVKIQVVERDPYEHGERALLNLGHTAGHAVETLSRYSMRHGEAVSIGMLAAVEIAIQLQLAQAELRDTVRETLAAWELPVRCPDYPVEQILQAAMHDKKKQAGRLRWILPYAPGDVRIVENVPLEIVRAVLIKMGAKE
jgi:3-dehydroquinate synthase